MARARNTAVSTSALELSRPAARSKTSHVWHPANAPDGVHAFSADTHVGTALRETFKCFARALGGSVSEIGLSLNAWFVLRSLWEQDGRNQVELARALDITPAAVVGLVNSLEASGFVERRRSSTDRRAQHVYLTASGRRLRAKATPLALRVDTRALQGISVREVELLLELLGRLRHNLTDLPAPRVRP